MPVLSTKDAASLVKWSRTFKKSEETMVAIKDGMKLKVMHPIRVKGVHKNPGEVIEVGKDIDKDDVQEGIYLERLTEDLSWKPAPKAEAPKPDKK